MEKYFRYRYGSNVFFPPNSSTVRIVRRLTTGVKFGQLCDKIQRIKRCSLPRGDKRSVELEIVLQTLLLMTAVKRTKLPAVCPKRETEDIIHDEENDDKDDEQNAWEISSADASSVEITDFVMEIEEKEEKTEPQEEVIAEIVEEKHEIVEDIIIIPDDSINTEG